MESFTQSLPNIKPSNTPPPFPFPLILDPPRPESEGGGGWGYTGQWGRKGGGGHPIPKFLHKLLV